MRILFAGGGTAGHINPALAIADYIKKKKPDTEILFVGTERGLEKSLVPHSGYDIKFIDVRGFERKLSLGNLKNLFRIIGSVRRAKKIIKAFAPDAVVGTGGYVSGPVLYAAAKMKIPTVIHETNAFAGMTSKILSRYVDVTAIAFEDGRKYLPKAKKIVVTGNPIRPELLTISKTDARRKLGVDERPLILIFGGSLGGRDFNAAMADFIALAAADKKLQIHMGTGKNNQFETVTARLREKINLDENPQIRVSEYIYDMDVEMNAADLLITRAGANTVSELAVVGRPAILIPSPNVTHNHQEYNARALEAAGGAAVLLERDLTGAALYELAQKLLRDENELISMGKRAKAVGVTDATEKIYGIIEELIK